MKRAGQLWSQIASRKNIEDAAMKAIKGKHNKHIDMFLSKKDELIDQIEVSLQKRDYRFGRFYSFVVHEPKRREIFCPNFYPDRILHHCLMNVIKPVMISKFTADTYGCIPGRGIASLAENIKRAVSANPDWYFLQIDIAKFYQSIDHDIAKQLFRRIIKCQHTIAMMDAFIDSHTPGVPIGAYPSQYIGNMMLSPVDHWVKEVAHIQHYFRYMDDMLFLLPNKESCHQLLCDLNEQITSLNLSIKNNVRIAPISIGIDYVGYKFYPTHTLLRKRIKIKMQRVVRKLRKWNVSDRKFKRRTASHFGWCMHADCRNLLRKTFNEKIYLYEKNMEIKRLSDIKAKQNWFGIDKDKRVSIEKLFGVEIAFFEHLTAVIKGEPKCVIRFAYPDRPDDFHFFITRSDVIMDRLDRDKELMPFLATVRKEKNYTIYE